MKSGKLLLAASVVALAATGTHAQTYKANFATKMVLAGGGVDPVHTVTFTTAAPGTSAITLTFPSSLPTPAGTYVLATDNTGALSWINPATGISLAGDVTGTAGATVVSAINGAPLGTTTPTAGNILIGSGTTWVTQALGGDATLGSDGTLTLANSPTARGDLGLGSIATQDATNVNITGGTIGGSTTVNTSGTITGGAITANGAVSLDAAPNTGGTNTIGNSTSTTNFLGTVTFPAGSVTAGSLGLAQNNILVGDASGHAAAYAPATNSVLITDATNGGTPHWATTLPSGLTIPGATISNPTLSGTITLPTNSVATGSIAHGAANTFLTTANDGTTVAFTGLNVGTGLSGDGVNTPLANTGVLSVTGTSPINAVTSAGGVTVSATTGSLTSSGSISVGGTGNTLGANITANLNMANTNDWTAAQQFDGGIASTGTNDLALTSPSGQAIDLNSTNGNAVNIGTGSGNTNAITIGNNAGPSITDINGTVNFGGTVSFPAGSVTVGSLNLANQNILVGNSSGHAAAVAPTANAVLITDNTAPVGTPQWSTSLPSGLTIPGATISNPTLSGTITLPTNSVATGSIAHGAANTFLTTANDGTTVAFTGLSVGTGLSGDGVNTPLANTGVLSVTGTSPINAVTSAGGVTVSATTGSFTSTGTTLTVTGTGKTLGANINAELNLANANTWTGEQTFSATGTGLNVTTNATVGGTTTLSTTVLSNGGTISVNADAADIVPSAASSYYFLSNTDASNSHSIGGITLSSPAVGTVIQMINTGTNPIVLLNQSTGAANTQFSIPGGNAIMASGGSATFIYDGTYWHLTANE